MERAKEYIVILQERSPVGRGLLTMKKSPAALARRPSNSQQQIISSSGVQACARQRSTCTCLWTSMNTLLCLKGDLQQHS